MKRDARAERAQIVRWRGESAESAEDWLAVEEPLEIRLQSGGAAKTLLTTMRTPGHDAELALGLLYAEGIVESSEELRDASHTEDPRVPAELRRNVLIVALSVESLAAVALSRRALLTNAACGVCGRTVIDDLLARRSEPMKPTWEVSADFLYSLPERLRVEQDIFERTGGLHATALFDLSGNLLLLREDIGRHNAMDKVVGSEFLAGRLPLRERVVLVSGRAGFEIVQKCAVAGVELLASVGAPSSLAADLALEAGMTLVGFLRDGRFNVYSVPERILDAENSK